MGSVRSWSSGAAAASAIVASLLGCRDATSIELQISTDLKCADVRVVTTSIGSGSLETYETRPTSAVTTRCDETTGYIGSLVLVPNQDDRAEVAVRIVTARSNKPPEECVSRASAECIVAHRVVRFVPHRALTLPIRMQNVCSGVVCGPKETCTNGGCVSSLVQLENCPPDGCEADLTPTPEAPGPPDAGAPPRTNGSADAGQPVVVDAGPSSSELDAGTGDADALDAGNGNAEPDAEPDDEDAGNGGASGGGSGGGKKPKKPKKN